MDRFNTNEDIEETPLMIAKDIIYSELTLDEKVKAIESAIISAGKLNEETLASEKPFCPRCKTNAYVYTSSLILNYHCLRCDNVWKKS